MHEGHPRRVVEQEGELVRLERGELKVVPPRRSELDLHETLRLQLLLQIERAHGVHVLRITVAHHVAAPLDLLGEYPADIAEEPGGASGRGSSMHLVAISSRSRRDLVAISAPARR